MKKDIREELSKEEIKAFHKSLLTFSDLASEVIAEVSKGSLGIERKGDKSVVTKADIEAEKALRKAITETYPTHGILGEEFGLERAESDFQWILDPVDGTEEFSRGIPIWGTIIGLHYKGAPVCGAITHPELGGKWTIETAPP